MAAAAVAPPPPEVEADEPGTLTVPVEVETFEEAPSEVGTETVAMEAVQVDEHGAPLPPVVEKPAEKAPAKPVRLQQFRTADGKALDEDKIEQALQAANGAVTTWNQVEAWINEDADFRVAMFKTMKSKGYTLTPQQEAEIAPKAPPKPPPLPMETIKKEYQNLVLQGKDGDAQEYWHKNVVQPHLDGMKEKEDAAATARQQDEAKRKAAQQSTEVKTRFTNEFAEAAKKFPSLVKVDAKAMYGAQIVDKQVLDHVVELSKGVNQAWSISRLIELALKDLGRYAPKKTATATTNVRPAVAGVTHTEVPKANPGEWLMKVNRDN